MPTPPTPPDLPDLNSPTTYNARALAWFGYISSPLYNWLSSLDASDWFSVQSSPTDTTPGKVMTVGAFGLGGTSQTAPNDDLNQCGTVSGLYHAEIITVNRPASAANLLVHHLARTDGGVAQIAVGRSTHDLYIRYQSPSAGWSEWVSVLPRRGSNANGDFVRFADGTQICWVSGISTSASEDRTWVFPAAFTYPSHPHRPALGGMVATTAATGAYLAMGGLSSGSSININALVAPGQRVAATAHLFAIGRWY